MIKTNVNLSQAYVTLTDIVYLARAIWFTGFKRLNSFGLQSFDYERTRRRLFKKRVMHINIFLFFHSTDLCKTQTMTRFQKRLKPNNHFQSSEIMSYLPLWDSRLMTSPWLYNPLIVLCLNNYPAEELMFLAVASI